MNPESRPPLLIVTTTFPRWKDDPGPAPFVLHHARALTKFFDVTVLAPHHPGAALEEELEGVKVRRFRFGPAALETIADGQGVMSHLRREKKALLSAPLLAAAGLFAVRSELSKMDKPFVNAHWLIPSGLATALAGAGPRLVITAHAADYDLLKRMPLGNVMARFMARRARAVVCVSERLAAGVKSMAGGGNIVIRPMGVDGERFRFDAAGREMVRAERGLGSGRVVLFVGKLSPKKGVDVLIRAAALLKKKGEAVKVLIVGDGEKREELRGLAGQLGADDAVEFLGGAPNRLLPGLYSAADAVAVPSVVDPSGETEGMPVVILEALLCGRPVVATSVCGAPDDLKGRGVIETAPGDSQELANALMAALDPSARVDREAALKYEIGETARFYAGLFIGDGK